MTFWGSQPTIVLSLLPYPVVNPAFIHIGSLAVRWFLFGWVSFGNARMQEAVGRAMPAASDNSPSLTCCGPTRTRGSNRLETRLLLTGMKIGRCLAAELAELGTALQADDERRSALASRPLRQGPGRDQHRKIRPTATSEQN
jgi:hypothetical protein